MYGDTDVMRRRATQLRDQGTDIRRLADQIVAQTEGIAWTGRAADAMRERIRDRAGQLREVAISHDTAADSLERHLHEVDTTKDTIADLERRATTLIADARTRRAALESPNDPDDHDDPDGVRRTPTPEDQTLLAFTPPPPGHRDWLGVNLPGL